MMDSIMNLLLKLKQKLSQGEIFFLSLLIGLGLLYLAYTFFLSEAFSVVNSKKDEIAKLEANYHELLKLAEIKESLKQDYIFVQKQVEEANRYIPTEAELAKVLASITQYAELRNINILSFNADFSIQEKSFAFEKNGQTHILDKLKVKKVKISVEGNYRQIIYFLYDLANTERTYVVREITLESLDEKDIIRADVEILIFFTKDTPNLQVLFQ